MATLQRLTMRQPAQHANVKANNGMEAMRKSKGCAESGGGCCCWRRLAAVGRFRRRRSRAIPNRPVRILVPYGPGGVADTTTRLLAQKLQERLGQQFVIDNRPGAGGIVASKAGATAAPDGYTLTLTGNGTAISKSLFKSLPYDVLRDFTSVSVMAWLDLLIATKADGPLKTVGDIIAAAKKNPGKLNFGTIAPGSTQHLSARAVQEHRRHRCHAGDIPHHARPRRPRCCAATSTSASTTWRASAPR